jgi:alpha-ketoglutaric semialdehyde dehydrogenase
MAISSSREPPMPPSGNPGSIRAYSFQGGRRDVGTALVTHPLIKAVGFTGSLADGRALFDLCVSRPEPIPFFGELGSVNPMFILPEAAKTRGAEIARGWANSLTMGAGQFCTNPGIPVILSDDADAFAEATGAALSEVGPQVMLTDGMAKAYRVAAYASRPAPACARSLPPPAICATLRPTFSVLPPRIGAPTTGLPKANGYPTGVEVCDAMVHGGPYPASTNFGATSVGTLSIRRSLRPVAYQNIPEALQCEDIKSI